MNTNKFDIREINHQDRESIAAFVTEQWGSPMSVSRGRVFDTRELTGFVCMKGNKIIGLLTYNIDQEECEIVTLNSQTPMHGLATQLINKVIEKAKDRGCKRVWLITSNENTHALRFYQKRGFEWAGFYKNAMDEARKLKPEIPELGKDDIPIKHEIEFEIRL